MKRTLFVIALLLIAGPALAVEPINLARMNSYMAGQVIPASGSVAGHCDDSTHDGAGNAVLICEAFDGEASCADGYTSTCQYTWSVTLDGDDALDFDNTTSPAPLQGTYSARLTAGGNDSGSTSLKSAAFTASDTGYAFARIYIDAVGTTNQNRYFMGINTAAGGDTCWVGFNNSNQLTLWNGASASAKTDWSPSADKNYCVWIDYVKNTATTGCAVFIAEYDSGCTKPGSPTHSMSSQASIQAGGLGFQVKYDIEIIVDHVRYRTSSAFGSNPD